MTTDDTQLGTYVYCAGHVGPHTSGWCGVPLSLKLGLLAADMIEAIELVKHLGLPMYGFCAVCYKYTANDVHSLCQDHTAAEYAGATRRRDDLDKHLAERSRRS